MRPSMSSKITRPERSGALEAELESPCRRGITLDALDLGEAFTRDCAWRALVAL